MTPILARRLARRALLLASVALWSVGAAATGQPSGEAGATLRAQVKHVIDGDTVVLADSRHVRLIGINAPELGKDGSADEPLAPQARAQLQRLAAGESVILVLGRETQDRYGRLLAHISLEDGRNVQEALLERGLAVVVAIPPNLGRVQVYHAAERRARLSGRGIWGNPHYAPKPAEGLRRADTGFRFVSGRVRKTWRSNRYVHPVLAAGVDVLIARNDLRYFPVQPGEYLGKRVVVRGWVTHHRNTLHIRVHHPAMVSLVQ
ncbi:MAG: thermonuclease family protein [Acidiferrobacterales bacterium]